MTLCLPLCPRGTFRSLASRLRFWRRQPAQHEARLVAAAKYGDPDAFDALVERYAPKLHAVARRMVGDDLAADVVQDAFLAAFQSMGGYRGTASFSTYLHTIVVNRCRRVGSKRAVHLPLLERPSAEPGPARKAESNLVRERIDTALRELPEEYREALGLREFSGLAYAEIAEVLCISVGTVKSRIARGRRLLRDLLETAEVTP